MPLGDAVAVGTADSGARAGVEGVAEAELADPICLEAAAPRQEQLPRLLSVNVIGQLVCISRNPTSQPKEHQQDNADDH